MSNFVKFVVVLLFCAISFNALSRTIVPIIDHIDVPVLTTSGKPLTDSQVRDAIIFAAQNRGWQVAQSPSLSVLSASLNVRGKHTVVVTIPYSIEKFSIKYANSSNMKYTIQDGTATAGNPYVAPPSGAAIRLIHPRYNDWVQDLLRNIQLEMIKF